ncbi:metallophosphoesterase family protein [Paenibacillus oleatilyticus]|uniref:Metallophosphoesterase family protein n=1 Tax=Paenibacillus oleatilyticus TaxID=2594886 RepID=A0ABV4UV64_9BACL
MNRTLVISDIHGSYESFDALLRAAEYNARQDRLILLGDYVDRGPRSKDVVERVMTMVREDGVIALRGNHDQRFVDVVTGPCEENEEMKFLKYGGVQTLASYYASFESKEGTDRERTECAKEWVRSEYGHHLAFLGSLPLFYEDERFIYVHAGLNPAYPNWKEQPVRDMIWIREPFYSHPTMVEKTVIFGHTRTSCLHDSPGVWFGGDKIGIDGGCVYGQQLNCLAIDENGGFTTYHVEGTNWER